ncbi:DUF1810 domain-containing protein [Falsirhodobacter algicola]|uniref:DUF1810 family protein n=1 Tax=Falsirhodobacter algicola TaxID=2692330 RepID=A0A8J8MV79_9RHOB|nr:DUF1810 domain-containing protein [Falsirhodobacter algicola]QUS37072.1 DUF1810 family protein [Falsirhodobacter algicola]
MTLDRFVTAQDALWPAPLNEIRRGQKTGHWMWFVFPQIAGLGRSPTAQTYAIASLEEARAYLAHPVLGLRLHQAADAALAHRGRPAEAVFGAVDAMKLRSSATLFDRAGGGAVFAALLDAFFDGPDPLTLDRIR